MNVELEEYKRRVEQNLKALTAHIANLGIAFDFEAEIEVPGPDEPLAEIFAFLKIIQDNLRDLDRKYRQSIDDLEERVLQRVAELQEKERTIQDQHVAIRELSTPVIQLWDRILMLPLIGTVDSTRGKQIGQNLLEAIARCGAAVAIIDVTGVAVLDATVADHLVLAIRGARLLGAEVILAGLGPHNAMTLAQLGTQLTDVITEGSLQKALARAMGLTQS